MTKHDMDHHARMAQQFEPAERALRAYRLMVAAREVMIWVAVSAAIGAVFFAVGALV